MSGEQLDLDEVEMRAARADNFGSAIYTLELDVPALVAEVRRLRQEIDECWVPLYHGALAERDALRAGVSS